VPVRLPLLAALAVLAGWAPAAEAAARPNIVVIETDDQTQAATRFMPALRDLVGAEGATFRRSFVSFPVCCPSRATLFTGQYAHNHGVVGNRPPLGGYVALDKTNWLPVWLQRAGYRTAEIGRTLNGYGQDNADRTEVPPGWDEWRVPLDPSTFDYVDFTLNENGSLVPYADYQTDAYNRMAVDLIERQATSSRPLFLYLGYSAPHSGRPHTDDDPVGMGTPDPAPRYRDSYQGARLPRPPSFDERNVSDKPQDVADSPRLSPERVAGIRENYKQELEALRSVDDGVRAIHDALARTGQLANTLLIFTSDNGYFHGEHRLADGKGLPYEASVRVPLLMRGPGVPRGLRFDQIVANVDLAPTILEAAGALPGRTIDGRSLLGLLRDRGREWGRDLLLENPTGSNRGSAWSAIRTYRYLYAEYSETGEQELYDLKRDPDELRSLDDDPRYDRVRHVLARRLHALRRCAGRSCQAAPRLQLSVRARPAGRAGRCVSGDLRVALGGRDRRGVVRMDVLVDARRVARDLRAPFAASVSRRRIRRGRETSLRARAVLGDGRVLTLDHRVRRCG
jgi:N-acetylglucosamine-6-sulfatase